MAYSPLPPLDPKVARLLRATQFGTPPAGAKVRVRSQLALAGIVTAARTASAASGLANVLDRMALRDGRIAEPGGAYNHVAHDAIQSVLTPSRPAHPSFWSRALDSIRAGVTKATGRPALMLTAGIAFGAAGALFSAAQQPPPIRHAGDESPRTVPHVPSDTRVRVEVDPAPSSSATKTARPAPSTVKKPTAADSLGLEQKVLAGARAALGRAELDLAMQELDRHARLFPQGTLSEEREALRIVALAQQGNLTAARERAARFRRIYPRSIQMSTVNGAVGERP